MQILRIIIVTIVIGWLAGVLGTALINGLRTGKIRHTDSRKRYDRRKAPFAYWALVCLFAGFLVLLGCTWLQITADAWTRIIKKG
jgi:hypothetical protein